MPILHERPRFTVPTNTEIRQDCRHGWINQQGRCQWCGKTADEIAAEAPRDIAETVERTTHLDYYESVTGPENGFPFISEDDKGRRWLYEADGSITLLPPERVLVGAALEPAGGYEE